MRILSVDVGTTAMKMGVFAEEGDDLAPVGQFAREYPINTYHDGLFSDIEPQKWQQAFVAGCNEMSELMPQVDVIALSGTTPGLTAMDKNGDALNPAILMLDQRSRTQAGQVIEAIGMDRLLNATANMPVAGGCSLASILWIKDNLPEVFKKTAVFGHSNTFMGRWLADKFAMDPSSASLTAMYNTVNNDMTWNEEILGSFGLDSSRLPQLMPADQSTGRLKKSLADELGLQKQPPVLIGGNDAVLAAYSVGVREPGEVFNINGTCEITMTCLSKCFPSRNYNIRTHVLPDRWFSFYVMNAGGKAFEWFKELFCSEMTAEQFFEDFIPSAVDRWLEKRKRCVLRSLSDGLALFLAAPEGRVSGVDPGDLPRGASGRPGQGPVRISAGKPEGNRDGGAADRRNPGVRRGGQPGADPGQEEMDAQLQLQVRNRILAQGRGPARQKTPARDWHLR